MSPHRPEARAFWCQVAAAESTVPLALCIEERLSPQRERPCHHEAHSLPKRKVGLQQAQGMASVKTKFFPKRHQEPEIRALVLHTKGKTLQPQVRGRESRQSTHQGPSLLLASAAVCSSQKNGSCRKHRRGSSGEEAKRRSHTCPPSPRTTAAQGPSWDGSPADARGPRPAATSAFSLPLLWEAGRSEEQAHPDALLLYYPSETRELHRSDREETRALSFRLDHYERPRMREQEG